MKDEIKRNDPFAIITQVMDEMQKEQGKEFDIEINIAWDYVKKFSYANKIQKG